MLRAANLILLLLYGPFLALWFLLSLYMHTALGFSAIQTGLAFVPPSIGLALAALFAPRFVARVGPRAVLAIVLLIGASGLLLLTRVSADGTYLSDVAPGAVLAAIGLGAALVPGTIAAMQGVPAEYNGIASGLTSTARLLGGALGLAVLTTLATSRADAELSSGAGSAAALVDGYQLAFAVGAAIALLAALLAAALLRQVGVPARALPRREDPASSTTPADTDGPAPALPERLRPRLR
jgi:MFS family permease